MRFMRNWLRRATKTSRLVNRARLHIEQLESRLVPYSVSGNAWPHSNLVTISFVPDGTNLGGATSNLFATFNAKWATTTWENQILNAAQVWAKVSDLNFSVITDNGSQIGSGNYQQGDPNIGDIRIGGYNFGSSTLASTYLPPPVNNYSIAGDIQFNTGETFNIGSTYDLFTVAAHEIGHALGLLHSTTANAIMYGSYNTRKTGLNCDDISGIQAIYGPARVDGVSNGTFATATNLTSQIDPVSLTALVSNLDLATTSDVDYYTFAAPATTAGTLSLAVQTTGLSLLDPTVTVYASDQTTVLGSATPSVTSRTGATLDVMIHNVAAGQLFYVKVAPYDATAFGTGVYALSLNFGSGALPTVPLPNTQTLAGSPPTTGGGQPDTPPPPDQGTPGRDAFTLDDDQTAQHGAASSSQQTRQLPPVFAFTLAAGSAVPLLSTPEVVAPARTVSYGLRTSQTVAGIDSFHARAAAVDGGGTSDDDEANAAISETVGSGIDAPVAVQAIDAFFVAAGQPA
jgi:predicted Zn-dependent protease